jgi:glycosyltransferase involved in cell wall biosynthesis
MNVLFVIHYPVFGGPHNQAQLLARSLTRNGVSMTVLLPDEPGNAAERLKEAGVDVITIPLSRLRASFNPGLHIRFLGGFPRDILGIREVIRARNIDLVQVGGLVNPHAAIAARLEKAAVVWQILDTRPPMALRRVMMPLVLRFSDVVMTTGRTVAKLHPGAERLGDRLRVFFPPVDPDAFHRVKISRSAARERFGFMPDDYVLGTVGNLNPQKGHEYLLYAAALARAREREVKVLVVGARHETHRAYEGRLYELSRQLGMTIGRDVVFTGALVDVRPALAAMDVFVLSSVPRSEGAPTAVEEAMMMELPVVATDVGAVREVVDDGQTGFVVPPRDPRALSGAILRILGDPQTRERFGRRARERAVARFSSDECARTHLSAYEYALSADERERRHRSR